MYFNNRSNNGTRIISIAIIVLIVLAIIGTAVFNILGSQGFKSDIHDLNGSIIGNEYIIDTFDNFGQKVLTTHGERIDIDSNIVEEKTYNKNDGWEVTDTLSAVVSITIDGKQLITCGDTCIFYDKNLTPEYNFYLNNIESQSDSIYNTTMIAGIVNSVKNYFGKPMVVVIKSQTGAPIYAFSGDKVYWTIPDDLPKFTKLMIDDKALYIHRANFQIIDKSLLG